MCVCVCVCVVVVVGGGGGSGVGSGVAARLFHPLSVHCTNREADDVADKTERKLKAGQSKHRCIRDVDRLGVSAGVSSPCSAQPG